MRRPNAASLPRRAELSGRAGPRPGAGVVLGTVLAVALAAFAVVYAATQPVWGFDSTYHFAYKGRLLFHEGIGGAGWTDMEDAVGRILTHPRYPPGLPALQALAGSVTGTFDADVARPLHALFVLGPAALLAAGLRGAGRGAAVAGALLWLGLPFVYYTGLTASDLGFALSGLLLGPEAAARYDPEAPAWVLPTGWNLDGAPDVPLAALLLGAFVHAWRLLPSSGQPADRADGAIAGLLLGGAVLCKNEGLALGAVMVLALGLAALLARLAGRPAAAAGRPSPWVGLGLGLALAALLSGSWLAARGALPDIDENYPRQLAALPDNLALFGNTGFILRAFQACYFPFLAPGTRDLALLWPLPFLALFWLLGGPRRPLRGRTLLLALVLVLAGAAALYLTAPVARQLSLRALFRWSLVWPLFFAALAAALARPRALLAHPALAPVLMVLGCTALYYVILVATPWDLKKLFDTLIPDRLVLHYTPIGILAAVLLVARRPAAPPAPPE